MVRLQVQENYQAPRSPPRKEIIYLILKQMRDHASRPANPSVFGGISSA